MAETRCPVRRNNLAKMQGYRIDSNGQPVIGESEQLCPKHRVCEGLLRSIVSKRNAETNQAFLPLNRPKENNLSWKRFDLILNRQRRPGLVLASPHVVERDLTLSDKVL